MSVKLNIGCGGTKLEGYVNIDVRGEVTPDVKANALKIPYGDCSVDEILAAHILEHIPHGISIDHPENVARPNVKDALKEWFRVLKYGGRLEIRVPNIVASVDYMHDGSKLDIFNMMILGGQENNEDFHRSVFNWGLLNLRLSEAGFVKIQRITNCTEPNGTHPANLVVEGYKP
jgi:hypothetical protein